MKASSKTVSTQQSLRVLSRLILLVAAVTLTGFAVFGLLRGLGQLIVPYDSQARPLDFNPSALKYQK